jgi:DNA-binding PadR family transcriptional regulator
MSGYDIKQLLQGLGWMLGSPSFGTIYPTLHALHEHGMVTVEVLSQSDRPLRKIYTMTQEGRQALEAWMAQPAAQADRLKSFIMYLILAGNHAQPKLVEHLEQRREAVIAYHAALEKMIDDQDRETGAGQELALDYGLATTKAELAWLNEKLTELEMVTPEVDVTS